LRLPYKEQKRIVAKVDQLMTLCDNLEAKLKKAQQHSGKLMEATVQQLLVVLFSCFLRGFMPIFSTIPDIELSEEGPVTVRSGKSKSPQYLHLRQGSLDGACGPYCFFMAMITLGLEKHNKLTMLEETPSSKALFRMITKRSSTLIREGTVLNLMVKYAKEYESCGLRYEKKCADFHGNSRAAKDGKTRSYKDVRDFVTEHVLFGRPVILGTAEHWTLVVGLGYESSETQDASDPRYFLLLDPNELSPVLTAWNGIFDIKNNNYWFGKKHGVRFEAALSLWTE
jgi:hypothetical protein